MAAVSGSDHPIPHRVLVVEDDAARRATIGSTLSAAGFETVMATDGEHGLTLLGRQSFPVVIAARAMPVLEGVEFVYRLRAIAAAPMYVIMVTDSNDAHEYERGYCAGVDHYLALDGYERELLAKVASGIAAMRRRQQSQAMRSDGPVTVDLENGAHTARHLIGRLHAEIAYGARVGQPLSVLSVCLEVGGATGRAEALDASLSQVLLEAVHAAVRPKLDWVARLPGGRQGYRLAIIMPEAGPSQVAAVVQGVRNAFVHMQTAASVQLTFGSALVQVSDKVPTALELLGQAERQRRGARTDAASDLGNVQGGDAG